MAEISIETETSTASGWSFDASIEHDDGARTTHTIQLSWQDYDLWSRGAAPPALVAKAVLTFLLDHPTSRGVPERFDAASIRRLHTSVDAMLPGLIG